MGVGFFCHVYFAVSDVLIIVDFIIVEVSWTENGQKKVCFFGAFIKVSVFKTFSYVRDDEEEEKAPATLCHATTYMRT